MKRLILVMIMFAFAGTVMAQIRLLPKKSDGSVVATDDVYYKPETEAKLKRDAAAFDTAQAADVNRVVFCLDNYHRERRNALLVGIVGGAVFCSGFGAEDNAKTGILVGGGIALLASTVMYIHAERWTSKKRLLWTGNGVALNISTK